MLQIEIRLTQIEVLKVDGIAQYHRLTVSDTNYCTKEHTNMERLNDT